LSLTYAGVSLPLATPQAEKWFQSIKPMDLFDYWKAWNFQGVGLENIPTPTLPDNPPFKIGVLSWPSGASRPPWFHFITTTTILDKIKNAIGSSISPKILHMDDGRSGKSIDVQMLMLPPIPLNQLGVDSTDGWLVTLTDQRFYLMWNRVKLGPYPDDFPPTWADMYQTLLPGITPETVPSAYLVPTEKWVSYYQPPGSILDAVASQVGQEVVFNLDGTVKTVSFTTAKNNSDTQYSLSDPLICGGKITPKSIGKYVPANIRILFGDATNPGIPQEPLEQVVTLASLALTEYVGETGRTGTYGQYYADLVYDGSNIAQVTAYAAQAARDWYGWRLSDLDASWPGIEPLEPTGWEDCIEWTYQVREGSAFASTRVYRPSWDDFTSGGLPVLSPNGLLGGGEAVWYTAYHHMNTPLVAVGAILPPETQVGTSAMIPSNAHCHFSLADGSSFLDFGLQSICGQTLNIMDWLPWPVVGTHADIPGPLYYPPQFQCTTSQAAVIAFIKSVFSPPVDGDGYVQRLGSTEHYKAEYWANDIYPENDYPPSNNQEMVGTPIYLAIKDNEAAKNVISTVIYSGRINEDVQSMVIVKHTTCACCDPIPFEITDLYDNVYGKGYSWKQLVLDRANTGGTIDQGPINGYVDTDPLVAGQYLYEINDNRMLTVGCRGLMWSRPLGYEFQVQEEFPAELTSTYQGSQGYAWKELLLVNSVFTIPNTILLSGTKAFEIQGNTTLLPGTRVWMRKNGAKNINTDTSGWVFDRPLVPPSSVGCGLSIDDDGILNLNLTSVAFDGLCWDQDACALSVNIGCNIQFGPANSCGTSPIEVDTVSLVGNAVDTSLVSIAPVSPAVCPTIGVDLDFTDITLETLVNNVTIAIAGGTLTLTKVRTTYSNYFNAAGLLIDRVPGPAIVTTTNLSICDAVDCCDAPPMTVSFVWDHSLGSCTYQFTSTVVGGTPPFTYFWDFDDGGTSTVANPTHNFALDGDYIVTLQVTDACGFTASFTDENLCPPPPPIATTCCVDPIPQALTATLGRASGACAFLQGTAVTLNWVSGTTWTGSNGTMTMTLVCTAGTWTLSGACGIDVWSPVVIYPYSNLVFTTTLTGGIGCCSGTLDVTITPMPVTCGGEPPIRIPLGTTVLTLTGVDALDFDVGTIPVTDVLVMYMLWPASSTNANLKYNGVVSPNTQAQALVAAFPFSTPIDTSLVNITFWQGNGVPSHVKMDITAGNTGYAVAFTQISPMTASQSQAYWFRHYTAPSVPQVFLNPGGGWAPPKPFVNLCAWGDDSMPAITFGAPSRYTVGQVVTSGYSPTAVLREVFELGYGIATGQNIDTSVATTQKWLACGFACDKI